MKSMIEHGQFILIIETECKKDQRGFHHYKFMNILEKKRDEEERNRIEQNRKRREDEDRKTQDSVSQIKKELEEERKKYQDEQNNKKINRYKDNIETGKKRLSFATLEKLSKYLNFDIDIYDKNIKKYSNKQAFLKRLITLIEFEFENTHLDL